jgi:putative MATE family efflux protein
MLGSAAQQVITLSDSVFLYHFSKMDFATIGIVSVFYLMIVAIAYGLSKGGQIIIARRSGEENKKKVAQSFYNLVYLELILATLTFFFLRYGTEYVFPWFIKSPEILQGSLEYIRVRAFGVFFSFAGVAVIAFLTGLARTRFIIYDTVVLLVVNVILNYLLIFGAFGFPEMGIRGAGLASALAEVAAFIVFLLYLAFSKVPRQLGMYNLPRIDFLQLKQILNLSVPIVSQSVVSLGGWFLFFSFIEKFLGPDDLATSNLVRNIYLIIIIPSWGFSSGINTLVSHFIGNRKRMAVIPIVKRTALLNLLSTWIIALPIILFPSTILYPLFGSTDMSLFADAQNSLYVLFFIISLYAVSIIYFNGMVGTGASIFGLKVQFIGSAAYLLVVYFLLKTGYGNLEMAWGSEILYWGIMQIMTWNYLRSRKWHGLAV